MAPVKPWVAGIDIGGTWTRFAAVGASGDVRGREKFPTGADADHEQLRTLWREHWATLMDRVESDGPPLAVGIGATGPVDRRSGRLLEIPNAGPGLQDMELVAEFGALSGVPVVLERDTCAALLAEARAGRGAGCSELVYVTVSTGIGGAAMTEGRLILGKTGGAAEIGHVVTDPTGPICGCGRRGCLEAIASGPAIAAAAVQSIDDPAAGILRRTVGDLGAGVTGTQVGAAAAAGDPVASAILDGARDALACAIVNLANTFDPECIIVGGSVAEGNPAWIETFQRAVAEQALLPTRESVVVLPAALGDDAVLLGAAASAWAEIGPTAGGW
jgi:glucokinase